MTEYATIIAATIAALASMVSLLLNTKLTINREKRKILWSKEIDRFIELEENCGILTEYLLSYGYSDEEKKQKYRDNAQYIRIASGRFRRYQNVLQALRDFKNRAGIYISELGQQNTREEDEEYRSHIEKTFYSLINACDKAVDRPK